MVGEGQAVCEGEEIQVFFLAGLDVGKDQEKFGCDEGGGGGVDFGYCGVLPEGVGEGGGCSCDEGGPEGAEPKTDKEEYVGYGDGGRHGGDEVYVAGEVAGADIFYSDADHVIKRVGEGQAKGALDIVVEDSVLVHAAVLP
ncbi:MAG: hypothetical protein A2Y07_10435 [Planctomycetes bacterium GWF2_50_10]|nr:MAG: hypothetical protein A2Y07_10435 [Planctomycetes bacterium GWF2_50_10]